MFQILVEESAEWPENGVLTVPSVYSGDISISPEFAKRKASGYLGMYVVFFARPKNPKLILNGKPRWQFEAWLTLPKLGEVAQICTIDVDACTGVVTEMSKEQIERIQEYANDIAERATISAKA